MQYEQAFKIAERIKEELKPFVERIQIAGSLRRKKQEIKDIEIVAVKKQDISGLTRIVNKWQKVRGEVAGRYTQRIILPENIKLDLFFATKENWGAILLIRTGNWEFSKKFMGTVMPKNRYKQKDGYVWKDDKIIPVFEEEDLFRLMKLEFIEPEKRDKNAI